MQGQVFAAGVTVLCWVAVAYKLPAFWRRPDDPALRAYWCTLLLIALGLVVLQRPIYPAIDALTGSPNLARLLGNGLALGASWTVQAFLFHLNYPRERARRPIRACGWALVLTLVLLTGFFLLIPPQRDDVDLLNHAVAAPFVLEYRLTFLAYLGLALINVARLSWRYAARAARPSMRLGLRLVVAGAILGLAYLAHEAAWVLAPQFGAAHLLSASQTIPRLLMASGIGLMVVGSTLPSWGPRVGVDALCQLAAHYRSMRRLYPLWRVLYEAKPDIALAGAPSPLSERFTMRDLSFRLYRRVIEIRDGLMDRRALADPRAAVYARQHCDAAALPEAEARAVIEAATLASALRAQAARRSDAAAVPAVGLGGGGSLADEVRFLERLAWCYRRSPIVRVVVRRLEREDAADSTPQKVATQ